MNLKTLKAIAVLAGVAAVSLGSTAQTTRKVAPRPAQDSAVETMFGLRDFQQAEISPDGKRVAWVESLTGAGGAPSPNSAIYVADISAPAAKKRITGGDGKAAHEEHDIAWSDDSKQLAFLSDAPKTGQQSQDMPRQTDKGANQQGGSDQKGGQQSQGGSSKENDGTKRAESPKEI